MLAYEREIQIPDDVSNYKNVMRFLNAIPGFRKGIIEGINRYPLVLGLGRIFGSINSFNEINEERLVVPLERHILPLLNEDRRLK
jgi:hypothetical protein